MAIIKPFKAVRPTADKVALVASKSYEEYQEEELNAILAYNPFSFLHIINPGFKFHKQISGKERFKLVRNRYMEFLEEGTFVQDAKAAYYLYQIKKNGFSSLGLFCATGVMDYRNDTIKKHEDTLVKREQLFSDYLQTVGFNAEPVLMTYADNSVVRNLLKEKTEEPPLYDFTSTDKIRHTLWRIDDPSRMRRLEQEFSSLSALYIADGHHRSASSNLLAKAMEKSNGSSHSGEEPYNYFMSYLLPESEIRIFEFNRMVKDLNGLSKEAFLMALDTNFRIEKKADDVYRPSKKHHFSMYLDGDFYSLYLRKKVYKFTDELSKLDTQILYRTILDPLLGIKDLRNDKRIAYGYGKYNLITMKNSIDAGVFQVGFGLVPITIDEVKGIADAHLVMPPKSTYIEPKLRSGLTMYQISN